MGGVKGRDIKSSRTETRPKGQKSPLISRTKRLVGQPLMLLLTQALTYGAIAPGDR